MSVIKTITDTLIVVVYITLCFVCFYLLAAGIISMLATEQPTEPEPWTIVWRTESGGGGMSSSLDGAKVLGWSPDWPMCDNDDWLIRQDHFIFDGSNIIYENCTVLPDHIHIEP